MRLSAQELIQAMVDPGSFASWDAPPVSGHTDPTYAATLRKARIKAGTDEAVVTGLARVRGHQVVLIVSEFGFLGGSIGQAAASRIVSAVRRATEAQLPVLAAPASGGTRMQEGTPAFVTMLDITRAVVDHKRAGLPYLVFLRNPTTGGVLASWGSLGHVTWAEPKALVGFLGPVVYESLHGQSFPGGVQVAENLVEKGICDAVVAPAELRVVVARTLALLSRAGSDSGGGEVHLSLGLVEDGPDVDPWASIELSRHDSRPGIQDLLHLAAEHVVPITGTGAGEDSAALVAAFASFAGTPCVVVGQDRRAQAQVRPIGPRDLRAARRLMALAEQLRLPLVCVIDTPGADLSVASEEGALAGEIARCLADFVQLTVASVSVLLGEGCGGAALALLPGRRVVAAEHSWLSPLPPEGASTILYGSTRYAADVARRQRVAARNLLDDGVVHVLVPEPRPAHQDPAGFCSRIAAEIVRQLRVQGVAAADAGAPRAS